MNYFDLHADTPLVLDSDDSKASAVDIVNHPFEKYHQTMAVYLRDNDATPFEIYNHRVELTKSFLIKNSFPFLNDTCFKTSGAILSVENAGFLAEDINRLYKLKEDGVKMLSLTWNGDNLLASGANGDGGITPLGREVIKEMNKLKIALDISHLSHRAALEGIELADRVLATHSVPYAINQHPRNIKESALRLLKEKQGIVGLCFYPLFLGGDNVMERLCASVEYLISLGFENGIAIGSDFDGAPMADSLGKIAHIPNLFNEFLIHGFKKSLLEGIFSENAIAFFGKMCENK